MGIWNRRSGRLPAPPPPPAPRQAAPAPEFLAPPPQIRAMLDKDSEVNGKLSFSGPARIDGTLRGEVRASDVLVIGESGHVDGTVHAASLVILGRVEGRVLGAERVEIGPRGVLLGALETRALVVQDGGVLDGDCKVAAPRATIHLLRARESLDGTGDAV
jgi:cytoskeletal protein CcmA (bactofilin family)